MANSTKKSVNVTLAENIKYWMRKRGEMTQAALATAAGVSQKTVSNYLNPAQREGGTTGREPSAKIAEIAKIADALQVEVWKLMRDAESDAERDLLESLDKGLAQLREQAQSAARALHASKADEPLVKDSRPLPPTPEPGKQSPGQNHQ